MVVEEVLIEVVVEIAEEAVELLDCRELLQEYKKRVVYGLLKVFKTNVLLSHFLKKPS